MIEVDGDRIKRKKTDRKDRKNEKRMREDRN